MDGISSRLIIGSQGFLDFTPFVFPAFRGVDLNGATIRPTRDSVLPVVLAIDLEVRNGQFVASIALQQRSFVDGETSVASLPEFSTWSLECNVDQSGEAANVFSTFNMPLAIRGRLKPLPSIMSADAQHLSSLIASRYVPYQAIPNGGLPDATIRALGRRFFPFTPYSYELAMALYDWTTASFARLVFMKVFQYTSMPGLPLCYGDIANMISESNWGPYTPENPDFMRSFMMTPAASLLDVRMQLARVATPLRIWSDVQNRLLTAAITAMPRTTRFSRLRLFSGQVDIKQFTTSRFGPGFLQCPINRGPIAETMKWDFENTLRTFVSAGSLITTKMVWSFTDTYQGAKHYSNGIILVIYNPPFVNPSRQASLVWDTASDVTPVSSEPKKTEWTFPPRSQFRVHNWFRQQGGDVIINLAAVPVFDQTTQFNAADREEGAVGDGEDVPAPVIEQDAVSDSVFEEGAADDMISGGSDTTHFASDTGVGDDDISTIPMSSPLTPAECEALDASYDSSTERKAGETARELKGNVDPDALFDAAITHDNHGRWCRCVQAIEEVLV